MSRWRRLAGIRALRTTLADDSVDVRIAAAEALCRIDREEGAVPVLAESLAHESSWVRLEAANALDRIGDKALPALDAIQKAVKDSSRENMFVRWVLDHTLKQLAFRHSLDLGSPQ